MERHYFYARRISLSSSFNRYVAGGNSVEQISPSPLHFWLSFCRSIINFRSFSASVRSERSIEYFNRIVFKSGLVDNINNLDDALDLYKKMVRLKTLPSDIHFSQLLRRIAKMKQYFAAILVYRDMCLWGFPINGYLLKTLINCYCLMNRVECALCALGSFFKRGYTPDATIYTTLLKGHLVLQRVDEAQGLFKKIIHEKLCQPNVVMFESLIDGLCKMGKNGEALALLRTMERGKCKPNSIVYNTIIRSLCKDKMVNDAQAIFIEMIDKGISPNIITYTCLIQSLYNNGKWKKAEKLLDRMADFDITPNVSVQYVG